MVNFKPFIPIIALIFYSYIAVGQPAYESFIGKKTEAVVINNFESVFFIDFFDKIDSVYFSREDSTLMKESSEKILYNLMLASNNRLISGQGVLQNKLIKPDISPNDSLLIEYGIGFWDKDKYKFIFRIRDKHQRGSPLLLPCSYDRNKWEVINPTDIHRGIVKIVTLLSRSSFIELYRKDLSTQEEKDLNQCLDPVSNSRYLDCFLRKLNSMTPSELKELSIDKSLPLTTLKNSN